MPFRKLDENRYPLSVFYDILKSGERVSNIYFNNEGYNFEKQTVIDAVNRRKEVNYYRDNNLMLGNIFGNNNRIYQVEAANGTLETSLEYSLAHVGATLFNIEGIRITSTSGDSLNIGNKLKIRTIDGNEITNVKTSIIKNNGITILPNAINIEISRNLEIGKTNRSQLVKVYNKTGTNVNIGDTNATNAAVKIELTTIPYTASNLETENTINYEEYAANPAQDPNNKKRNLWLLGNSGNFWRFDNSWLENPTNQAHIQYLTKAIPDVETINIIGESNILPDHHYIFNHFFTDTSPETITHNGHVQLATAASLSKFKYSFDGDSTTGYLLEHEGSTGKIDYLDSKYTIKYPVGYTEDLNTGAVQENTGGLLGFIPKGTKITFIEDPNQTKIKIVPVLTNNVITEFVVYANEFIFD